MLDVLSMVRVVAHAEHIFLTALGILSLQPSILVVLFGLSLVVGKFDLRRNILIHAIIIAAQNIGRPRMTLDLVASIIFHIHVVLVRLQHILLLVLLIRFSLVVGWPTHVCLGYVLCYFQPLLFLHVLLGFDYLAEHIEPLLLNII